MDVKALDQEEYANIRMTFSIEAEDLMVERIYYHMLGNPLGRPGFYVDLGAYDPIRSSNTHYLYKKGWHGLNVEVNPNAIENFRRVRERDTTVHAAVGPDGDMGQYYSMSDPLLNGFLREEDIQHHLARGYHVLSQTPVQFMSVNRLLSSYVPEDIAVDYLNIDVECMEHSILSEWDFSRWMPQVISVEIHGSIGIDGIMRMPIVKLLEDRGYTFISRLWHTSIFAKIPK